MKKFLVFTFLLFTSISFSQELKVFRITDKNISIDGLLNEPVWEKADSITNLKMVEPNEGTDPSFKTVIKILADEKNLYLGIRCYDKKPEKIISYSKIRDSRLGDEDKIKFVFDTNLDKRSGYIFAVNPTGTRYDALVSDFGEGENSNWDGVWDAATNIDSQGWTAEIIIPIQSISFSSKVNEWGFNFERKIQRKLEIDRWTNINRNLRVGHVINAGRITNLPKFNLGIGLTSKFSGIFKTEKKYGQDLKGSPDYSLDFTQKITSDVTAHLTINTDFAETEVDARRTNLTRFPLFFPEKRDFFLEGTDIFDFGLGLGHDVVPFFSRRIGLYKGTKVPIIVGGKLNGKVNDTNFGALVTRTAAVDSLLPTATLGSFRVKQNIFRESSVGIIGTFGDPKGNKNVWLLGVDFTYQTSYMFGNKSFLVGVWGLYNNNSTFAGDNTAMGMKIDYPNDLWDISIKYKRIGDAFKPSLGFVPRPGTIFYTISADYMPRPDWKIIRQFFFESAFKYTTDLNNNWEDYLIFTAPIHFLLESGDRFEFNISPRGENLKEDFEIDDGVIIKSGKYHWQRYRFEFESASKRLINGQATWWFGSFYDGYLDQIELEVNIRPASSINLSFNYEKNIVDLPEGYFTQDLFGGKLQFSFAPDFELSSFIQYDTESKSIGTNSRLRWTFAMLGDLFVVYNHNINKITDNVYQFESNEFIIKLSYGFWL